MDPPPHFRRHLRYGNVPHPPHFIPHYLPPPPPPPLLPPHNHLPPPPPLFPPRHNAHLLFPSDFSVSPPHRRILERSHLYEFVPPEKPHFDRFFPPPPRGDLPFRTIHDYPHPNSRLEDEIILHRCSDDFFRDSSRNWDGNLRWGMREYNSRVSQIEHGEWCDSSWISEIDGRELFRKRNCEARKWEYGIEREDDERRWEFGINGDRELYIERENGERRRGYGIDDAFGFQLDHRGKEPLESNLGLGRCSGRFGREVGEREVSWSTKMKRVQKKSALHRIQLGKACGKRNRGQKSLKNMNRCSFKWKGKKDHNCLKAIRKDGQEREQSPIALSISFKSNSLVAKAILVPSSPTVNERMDLSARDRKTNKINCLADLPLANSSKDLVVNEHAIGLQSDLQGTRMEMPEKLNVSGNENVIADEPCDFGDNFVENKPVKNVRSQGFNNVESGRRIARKKKAGRKQVTLGISTQMTKESFEIVNSNPTAASPSDVSQPKTNCTLPKVNLSSAFIDAVPDAIQSPSLGSIVSEKGNIDCDCNEPSISNSKSKRSILKMCPASSCMIDDASKECHGHSGRVVITNEDASCGSKLGTDMVTVHAVGSVLADKSIGYGDSIGINHHAGRVDICAQNGDSILTTENNIMEANNLFPSLRIDRVDNINERSFHYELSLLENSLEVPISDEGEDISGLETRISEVLEDNHLSEYHESCTSSVSESELPKNIENGIVSDKRSADGNSKESIPSQVTIPEVDLCCPSNAEETRILLDAAVANCSDVSLGTEWPNFLSTDHIRIGSGSDVSYLDTEDGKILNESIHAERSPEAINHVKTCFCVDYLPKIKSSTKAKSAQIGISGSNSNVLTDAGNFVRGQLTNPLSKDISSAEEVNCPGEIDNCGVDFRLIKRPSEDEDSHQDGVDFSADDGCRKKRKVVSSGSTMLPFAENVPIGDFIPSDCSKLDQVPPRQLESRYNRIEGFHSATYMEIKDERGDISISGMDETLIDGNERHVKDDQAFFPVDGNGACDTKSGDALMVSGFDVPSYMSSPEDLLYHSDLCFLRDINSLSSHAENEMIFGRPKTSETKPVSGVSNTLSLGKSIENATFDHTQTNASISPSLSRNPSKVVQQFSLVNGKLSSSKKQLTSSTPKIFPGIPAVIFNNSKKFPSSHVTKSRTWHRTGTSSIPVAGPKLQSCPLPHSRDIKTRDFQNFYIRQGNSLVRKPSSSGATSAQFHTLNSSVYQLSLCIDDLKKSQAIDIKVDAPSISRIGQVNASERSEALPIDHTGKSSSSASYLPRKSLPVSNTRKNVCSINAVDASKEIVKSSVIPEYQIGSGTNSDGQCTVGKGNPGKKITYVKRKSNQLVATSDPEDSSISGLDNYQTPLSDDYYKKRKNQLPEDSSTSGLDNFQTSLSDGYYKKRKNQLIRVPSESHMKEGDGTVNINFQKLKSQTKSPRSSSKRQSSKGFNKTHRSSKFSLVWKLRDAQGSNKDTNTLGPKKLWPYFFPSKKTNSRRTFIHALGSRPNNSSSVSISKKLLLSRKRGAIYTRSTHGFSLRISKVLSVGGSSLKWSKSIEKNSKKANEEATLAVAAAERRKKEEKGAIPSVSKSKNHVSRKSVVSVRLPPGERIFRVGSERYKMDPTRRTLHRITAEEEPSTSAVLQSEKNSEKSYVPKRLLIGIDEYVRIGNGNQLVRDPKKRTRVLASEKVRWSLRTARLRLARKRKYCQFFTRYGKCNKSDGKCPYIHDTSKIAVCTKFLNGSCYDPECKLTHKVIPERMPDCSYFLKGSCSNESCPYRHANVNPNSSICKRFLRGYCADGNECPKKHTYVCPAFESTGICLKASTCKLHHPKKKTENKPAGEQKNARGRYFDGGLIDTADCGSVTSVRHAAKGKDNKVCEGDYPDYISLDISDDEVE